MEKGGKEESIFGLLVSLVTEKKKDKTFHGFCISIGHPLGRRSEFSFYLWLFKSVRQKGGVERALREFEDSFFVYLRGRVC